MTKNPLNIFETFQQTMAKHKLSLIRGKATTMQINVGYLCNLTCKHCHLDAGPGRNEIMSQETASQIVEFAAKNSFDIIDITGGAPEMNPNLPFLIKELAPFSKTIILRSNLVALRTREHAQLIALLKDHQVHVVASFPAINKGQLETQRGTGVFRQSIEMLQQLNQHGFGKAETGLKLSLVVNPAGAFMPAEEASLKKRFEEVLRSKWNIEFSDLFSFANVPLGRFKKWLDNSGNFEVYMNKLIASFNPCAIDNVMCRSLFSISWDGYLYDCDFNQAIDLPLGSNRVHISSISSPPGPGQAIASSDHCYACTAGSGFT